MLQVYNIDFYPQLELILWSVTNARYQLKRLVNYTSLRIGEKRLLVSLHKPSRTGIVFLKLNIDTLSLFEKKLS